MRRKDQVVAGSGNIFADLGLPNPDEALAKADVVREISRIVLARKLTQTQAGEILGIGQPRVSELMRGRVGIFSLETLINFAKKLGYAVKLHMSPSTRPRFTVQVDPAVGLSNEPRAIPVLVTCYAPAVSECPVISRSSWSQPSLNRQAQVADDLQHSCYFASVGWTPSWLAAKLAENKADLYTIHV